MAADVATVEADVAAASIDRQPASDQADVIVGHAVAETRTAQV